MKFTIQQRELLSKTQHALKFISTKPQLPILSCFLFSVTSSGLTLSATNLQEGIQLQLRSSDLEEGSCAVPAKVLVEFLSTLDDQGITCSIKENQFILKIGRNSIKIQTMSVIDYPVFPEREGEQINVPLSLLKNSSEKIAFASGRDESRPILTSILFSLGEKTTLVSTDGFRLAKIDLDFSSSINSDLLFPSRILQETTKILQELGNQEISVYISEKLKQGFFCTSDTQIMIRLLDGEFPKYEQIFPQKFSLEIRVIKEELEKVIKSALIFARESSGIIQFNIQESEFRVLASSSSVGEFNSLVAITSSNHEVGKIAFNGKYVLEFLQKLDAQEVWFKMNDEVKPGLFIPEGEENYQYLVMPFKLN